MSVNPEANRVYVGEPGWHQLVPEAAAVSDRSAQELIHLFGLPTRENLSLALLVRVHCAVMGISKKELANRSGVMPCTLSHIENNPNYSPQPITLQKLEVFFGLGFGLALDLLFSSRIPRADVQRQI